MLDFALALLMLSALLLVIGAAAKWRRGQRRPAILMVVLAVVMALNVAIWVVPLRDGGTLFARAAIPQ